MLGECGSDCSDLCDPPGVNLIQKRTRHIGRVLTAESSHTQGGEVWARKCWLMVAGADLRLARGWTRLPVASHMPMRFLAASRRSGPCGVFAASMSATWGKPSAPLRISLCTHHHRRAVRDSNPCTFNGTPYLQIDVGCWSYPLNLTSSSMMVPVFPGCHVIALQS